MATDTQAVVQGPRVILPKKPSEGSVEKNEAQFHVWWKKDLIADIKALAKASGRSITEASELLMGWAVERAKQEYEAKGIKIQPETQENKEDQ